MTNSPEIRMSEVNDIEYKLAVIITPKGEWICLYMNYLISKD